MNKVPISQRLGLENAKPIYDDFPESARVALGYLLADLVDRGYTISRANQGERKRKMVTELYRTCREGSPIPDEVSNELFDLGYHATSILQKAEWEKVYILCEWVYEHLLTEAGYVKKTDQFDTAKHLGHDAIWKQTVSLEEVRNYSTKELNEILDEENIGYQFTGGQFHRRGRAQTQKNFQRVGSILGDSKLRKVRTHYNKARKFFDERPEPDVENCVKEALCALEVCLTILTQNPADFTKVIKQYQGNGPKQIPSPIAQGMIKLHDYRGSGEGVAHAALGGNKVTDVEAEFVLSAVATYITYLVELLSEPDDEIPF